MMQTSLPVFATTPPPPGSSRSASPSFSGYHTDTSASAAEPRSVLGSASSISAPDLPDDHDDFDDGASVWETEDHQAAADQQAEGQIEVDDHELGSDLGYESEGQVSASTSLDSGMRDYIFENGRRYHRFREGRYNFPNDDVEYVFSPSPVCVCVVGWWWDVRGGRLMIERAQTAEGGHEAYHGQDAVQREAVLCAHCRESPDDLGYRDGDGHLGD